MSAPIGLIGLGAMGRGMAGSLRRAGYAVHVFDVRPEAVQAFTAEGGIGCASPADLAARCDIVVSVVVNAAQTEEVLFGAQGAARGDEARRAVRDVLDGGSQRVDRLRSSA